MYYWGGSNLKYYTSFAVYLSYKLDDIIVRSSTFWFGKLTLLEYDYTLWKCFKTFYCILLIVVFSSDTALFSFQRNFRWYFHSYFWAEFPLWTRGILFITISGIPEKEKWHTRIILTILTLTNTCCRYSSWQVSNYCFTH